VNDPTRFLLLQVRNPGDPMAENEIACFGRAFGVPRSSIRIFDLLRGAPRARDLEAVDVVLLGGSGDYSVARGGPWLPGALEAMVILHETSKPTFASCWGFQAMARALGGEVVTDRSRAEVGSTWLELTRAGESDPVFGPLGKRFQAQVGHEDIVTALPGGATLLASSDRVENQAFRLEGKPIYCTQFHPELSRRDLLERIRRYPAYLPLAGASSFEELERLTPETPETEAILARFLETVRAVA
jgi:GMP synthase (glutamine-hydrolysing)